MFPPFRLLALEPAGWAQDYDDDDDEDGDDEDGEAFDDI